MDGNNIETKFEYDNSNKLIKVTDANNFFTKYEYNEAGNISKVTDVNNNSVLYSYNVDKQILKVTDQLLHIWENSYDTNGKLTKSTTPNGNIITNIYNGLDQLESTNINGSLKWSYTYDMNGRLQTVNNDVSNLEYYENNSLKKETDRGNSEEYTYTENSSVDHLTYSVGTNSNILDYDYIPSSDGSDLLDKITRNSALLIDFDYNQLDNLDIVRKQNDTFADLDYDTVNRLSTYVNKKNDGTLLNSYTYSYDGNDNVTKIVSNTGTSEYAYDKLNQLTKETREDGTVIEYGYDKIGNRVNKKVTSGVNSETTTYSVNSANQITSENGQAYTYDNDGNLVDDGMKTYIYNELDQLIEIRDRNNQTIFKAKYDDTGKRIQTETSSGVINYFYNGYHVIYETNANNELTVEYSWDDHGNPVTMTKDGETYYYNLNGHGDVVSISDGDSNIVAQYQYDAWGNILSSSGIMESTNPYRYAGYRYDYEAGLYYLMARYYNARDGRFISKDSYDGDSWNPLSQNLYTYVENNPLINIDTSGNMTYKAWWYVNRGEQDEFISESWSSLKALFKKETYQIITAVLSGKISIGDLANAFGDELATAIKYQADHFNHVYHGRPTKDEAYSYGRALGKVERVMWRFQQRGLN